MALALAMFDMAGTTVDDTIEGRPLVLHSFAESFATLGITVPWEVLNAQRGKDKRLVFHSLLAGYRGLQGQELEHATQRLLQHFTARLLANVEHLREIPGTTATFAFLKARCLFIALGSGFPLAVTQAIADRLGWRRAGLVDFVTCGEAAGGGRPQPHMINRALQTAGLLSPALPVHCPHPGFNYQCVLKVGDTVQDVAEGRALGALTIAVTSGTQSAAVLAQAGADAVLPSVAALPQYLTAAGVL